MNGKLRDGWSIAPIYRGCETAQGFSTAYRGRSGPSFDRKRDAVQWINSQGQELEQRWHSEEEGRPHAITVGTVLDTGKWRPYCTCGWWPPLKWAARADAEAAGAAHVREATSCHRRHQ